MDYAFSAFLLNIVYFVLAIGVGWLVLRGLDKLSGRDFKSAYNEMCNDKNLALALYFGARFVGICVVAASFLS